MFDNNNNNILPITKVTDNVEAITSSLYIIRKWWNVGFYFSYSFWNSVPATMSPVANNPSQSLSENLCKKCSDII